MSNKSQWRHGLPLRLAIVAFATEQWRKNAELFANLESSLSREQIIMDQRLLWSESLLLRLLDGEVVAYGVPDGGKQAEVISADILRDADPDFSANILACGIKYLSIRIYEATNSPKVKLPDQAAPTPDVVDQIEAVASVRRRPPSRVAIERFYKEWILAHANTNPHPSFSDDWAAAKKVMPTVTRDAIRDARANFAPQTWKQRGARKRNARK